MIPEHIKKPLDEIMEREGWRLGEVHALLLGASEGLLSLVVEGFTTIPAAKQRHAELIEAREYAYKRFNERYARKEGAA